MNVASERAGTGVAGTAGADASTTTPVPGVASTGIADLLRGPDRPLRVLAVFPAAVYLAADDEVLALVATDGVHHPNAVVVARRVADHPFDGVGTHARAVVGRHRIVVADLHVAVARWSDPVPHLHRTNATALAAGAAAVRDEVHAVTGAAPELSTAPLRAIVDAVAAGEVAPTVAAARRLLGAGPGLTPAGDDVLCGLVAGTSALAAACDARPEPVAVVRALGAVVADLAPAATTAVSAALLRHAARGEVAAPAATVLHALTGRVPATPAVRRLLAVGATSGRDLALGLLAAADVVLAAAPTHDHAAAAPAALAPSAPLPRTA